MPLSLRRWLGDGWVPEAVQATPLARRPWTRLGTCGMAAHVFYEYSAGVGMPYASRLGPIGAPLVWASAAAAVHRQAGRRSEEWDRAFALVNGLYLGAVLGHYAGWPHTARLGVPWLTQCEGLKGPLMPAYNLMLLLSGVSGLAALRTECGRHAPWGLFAALSLAPLMVRAQHREHERLVAEARRRPAWWNRRLAPAMTAPQRVTVP
jgi:hypothetical protein